MESRPAVEVPGSKQVWPAACLLFGPGPGGAAAAADNILNSSCCYVALQQLQAQQVSMTGSSQHWCDAHSIGSRGTGTSLQWQQQRSHSGL